MPDFSDLHLLRPSWLLLLLPAGAFYWLVAVRGSSERQWRNVIAPHLLPHLMVGDDGRARFRPVHLVTAVLVLASLSLAGPTWERQRSPLTDDTAPLVVALDVSTTMDAVDIQPSRLERAKQKLLDLLALRKGSRTAVIAYAGSAHVVLPFSDDPTVFETYVAALDSSVMPVAGKDAAAALAIAEELLERETTPGSILFLTDAIEPESRSVFASHRERSRDELMLLAVGTPEGGAVRDRDGNLAVDTEGRPIVATFDPDSLRDLGRESGMFVAGVTIDDADVGRLQRRVRSHLEETQQEDETQRWRDFGYYLVFPVAVLALLWFRRGWTVRWAAVLGVFFLQACSPARETRFVDLWLTPDQQGRWLFERQQPSGAAQRFQDPSWRAAAHYEAEELEEALTSWALAPGPESDFNLGNTYARLSRFDEAVASYERALAARPDWRDARENLELVRSLIPPAAAPPPPPAGGDPTFDADEMEVDEKGEQGEEGEVEMEKLADDQLAEMWMRRFQATPADFLRQKFAFEAAEAEDR